MADSVVKFWLEANTMLAHTFIFIQCKSFHKFQAKMEGTWNSYLFISSYDPLCLIMGSALWAVIFYWNKKLDLEGYNTSFSNK